MKTEILSFVVKQKNHRVHRMLFDDELPFKPKVEKVKKTSYQRKLKHRNNFEYFID